MASNRTHWDPISNFSIGDRDRKKPEEGAARFVATKMLLVHHIQKPEILKSSHFWELLDKCLGRNVVAMRVEELYVHILLMPSTGGRLLITANEYSPQTGRKSVELLGGKNPEHSVILNGSEY